MVTVMFLVLLGSCGKEEGSRFSADTPADWQGHGTTTIDGQPWTLADHQGKVILLDFWATWCGPCKAWEPWLKEVHDRFSDREDFVMVGVALDETAEPARDYCRKKGMDWVQLHEPGKKRANSLAKAFGVQGLPAVFLILRDGHVVRLHGFSQTLNPVEAALDGLSYGNRTWYRDQIYGGRQEVANFFGPPSAKEVVAGQEMWQYELPNDDRTQTALLTVQFQDSGEAFVASSSESAVDPGLLNVRISPEYWSKEIAERYSADGSRYALMVKPAGQEYPLIIVNRSGGHAGRSLWQDVEPGQTYSRRVPGGRFDLLLVIYDRDRFEQHYLGGELDRIVLRSDIAVVAHETTEIIIDPPTAP